jgi:hypothetical protein
MTQKSGIALCVWLVATIALGLKAAPARAGIGTCGDIHVEASAQCELVPPGVDCKAMCKPVAVRAACAATLAADCTAGCDELPSVDCSGACSAGCAADCSKLKPGEFDCQGSCEGDCSGRCAGQCRAKDDAAGCEASCKGSCSASCEGSCKAQPPKADCDASCAASCDGSCGVDANLKCQLDCQAAGQADCEAEVEGGCEGSCNGEEGALFCDGQYVDHGDNLKACADALKAALDIDVQGDVSGEAGCTGGKGCAAEGQASAKLGSDCTVARPGAEAGSLGPAWLAMFGFLAQRVRRSRSA